MKKRVYALLLAMCLVLGLCACGEGESESTEDTVASTDVASTTAPTETEVTAPTEETQPTEATDPSDDPTEPTETENQPTDPSQETNGTTTAPTEATTTEPTSKPQPTETTTTPTTDPNGPGTKNNPISSYPGPGSMEEFTIKLTEIPAGGSVYYALYRVGGTVVTLESSNAYVVYGSKTYKPSNGKVSFSVDSSIGTEEAVIIEVYNTGSSAVTFTLNCKAIVGTYGKPQVLPTAGEYTNEIGGNDQGYYLNYVAEKSGTLRITLKNVANSKAVGKILINVNDKANSKNATNSEYGGNVYDDYAEIEVSAGDTIEIIFSTLKSGRKYLESEITWTLEYQA